jgi:hypothetical protein
MRYLRSKAESIALVEEYNLSGMTPTQFSEFKKIKLENIRSLLRRSALQTQQKTDFDDFNSCEPKFLPVTVKQETREKENAKNSKEHVASAYFKGFELQFMSACCPIWAGKLLQEIL